MRLLGEYLEMQFILAKIIQRITFHHESVQAITETVVSRNWEADHGSERNYRYSNDLDVSNRWKVDGVPVEDFSGSTSVDIPPAKIQEMMTEMRCVHEHKKKLSSCQCFMTLNGENQATGKTVLRILSMLRIMLENSRKGIGRFLGLDQKRMERNSRIQTKWRMGRSCCS